MKRILCAFSLLFALLILFSACARAERTYDFEVGALGEALLDGASFDDELVKMNESAAKATFQITADAIAAYAGSGATAEEIVILDTPDRESAEAALRVLTSWRDSRSTLFAGYNPGQVPLLEHAILMTADHYAIYCVCADASSAQRVIDDFLAAHVK